MKRPAEWSVAAPTLLLLGVAVCVGASCDSESGETGFEDLTGGGGGSVTSSTGGSTSSATTGSGTGGTTGVTTGGSTTSSSTTTTSSTGSGCVDSGPGEPNETEGTAYDLGTITDADGDGSSVSGTMDGPGDVDWYVYQGDDVLGSVVDPTRVFTSSEVLQVCKYAACNGATFTCPNGTTNAFSPDAGYEGCCGTTGFVMDLDCSGSDDDSAIYIRIANPDGHACASYTLQYHY